MLLFFSGAAIGYSIAQLLDRAAEKQKKRVRGRASYKEVIPNGITETARSALRAFGCAEFLSRLPL